MMVINLMYFCGKVMGVLFCDNVWNNIDIFILVIDRSNLYNIFLLLVMFYLG